MAIPWLSWVPAAARWVWNKIRARPTVQADRGGVAAGRDQTISGAVVTGDRAGPIIVAQAGAIVNLNVYLDGLREARPEVRDHFEEGLHLQQSQQHEAAIEEFRKALAAADDDSERCALHILVGRSLQMRSRLRESEGHYRQAVDAARKAHDTEGEAFALGYLGLTYEDLGEPSRAQGHFKRALAAFKKTGDRGGQAAILTHLAMGCLQRRRARKAWALAERAVALHPLEPGYESIAFLSLVALGQACESLDDSSEASRRYAEALEMAGTAEDKASWAASVAPVLPTLRRALDRLGSASPPRAKPKRPRKKAPPKPC